MAKGKGVPTSAKDWAAEKFKGKLKVISGREAIEEHYEPKLHVSTGILPLDLSVGRKGLGTGRIYFVSGRSSEGKSVLVLYLMRAFQEAGGAVVLAEEGEAAVDLSFAEELGVSLDDPYFYVNPGKNLEEAYQYFDDMSEYFIKHRPNQPILYAIDSISGLTPGKVEETDYGADLLKMGPLEARIHKQYLRKLRDKIRRTNIALLGVSHLIANINMNKYVRQPIGEQEITTGGKAWIYLASTHWRCHPTKETHQIYRDKEDKRHDRVNQQIGTEMRIQTIKTRGTDCWKNTFLPFYSRDIDGHSKGWDIREAELIFLRDRGLVGLYSGKDKTLTKAKASVIKIDDKAHTFVGLSGWKKLLSDQKIQDKVHALIVAHEGAAGSRDQTREDAAREISNEGEGATAGNPPPGKPATPAPGRFGKKAATSEAIKDDLDSLGSDDLPPSLGNENHS